MNDSARSEAYLLAAQNGYNANELVQYLEEDKIGGYHVNNALATWPSGSLWESEGQILYALTRYLKPERIVEIGTLYGCSATHFATALMKNGTGRITVVDNRANGKFGELIPLDKWAVIDKVEGDGGDFLESLPDNSVDLIFEDAGHGEEDVYRFTLLALRKLKPGGLLINHDAGHDSAMYLHEQGYVYQVSADEGAMIRAGLTRAGADFQVYKPHESDCGFAVTKKPVVEISNFTLHEVSLMPDGSIESAISIPHVDRILVEPDFRVGHGNWNEPPQTPVNEEHPLRDAMSDIDLTNALATGAPLNSDGFLKPMPTLPPDGSETLEALESEHPMVTLTMLDENIPDDSIESQIAQFKAEREATEPPAEKKPRKKRVAKGKS